MDLRENKALSPVESGFPISAITIDLTKRCNLACDYCFAHCYNQEREKTDLSPELGKKIIDWVMREDVRGNTKSLNISFWGGEPLLKWDLMKELILYAEDAAEKAGINVTFGGTTNVTLLTEEKFWFLEKHKCSFLLSIDGRPEQHDRHRKLPNGEGSFKFVDKNVDAILQMWPRSSVRLSHSTETIDTFLDDLKYLYDRGFRDIAYSPVSEGDWTEERLETLRRVWREIADWYIERYKSGDPVNLKFLDDACGHYYGNVMGDTAPCGAGRGYIGITTDGAFYPCHRFNKFDDPRPWYEREVCLGHIDYGILNQEWRKNFIDWSIETSLCEDCSKCELKGVACTGGCWATNWDLAGALSAKVEPGCTGIDENMKLAEKLDKELGEEFRAKFIRPRMMAGRQGVSQGCVCYNVCDQEGTPDKRYIVNRADNVSCICNQTNYGQKVPFTGCVCYNVCNQEGDFEFSYYDNKDGKCNLFQMNNVMQNDIQHKCECKDPESCGKAKLSEEDTEIARLKEEIAKEEELINQYFKRQEVEMLKAQLDELVEIRMAMQVINE